VYEVGIIGAGAAGIEAAKACLKYGVSAVLISENEESFGGTCLNKGCIPLKSYLVQSQKTTNFPQIFSYKNKIVNYIKQATLNYLKKRGIKILWGRATLLDVNKIKVDQQVVTAKNIIIACGSLPRKIIDIKDPRIFFVDDIFSLPRLPTKFLVVGAGPAGLEIASFLNNLNKQVLVIEKEDRILPGFDKFMGERLKKVLQRKGIKIEVSTDIENYSLQDFDMIILSAGRVANSKNLDLEKVGVMVEEKGWIKVDDYLVTNIGNIYAVGDIIGKELLAYVAQRQGQICVENILGKRVKETYFNLPRAVFSSPNLAVVGVLREEAEKMNLKYEVIRTNFLRFSSSYVYNDADGYLEILVDPQKKIMGAGIISSFAGELISIFSLALNKHLSLDDLKNLILVHPTLNEIIPSLLKE